METKLKPCPFCGGSAGYYEFNMDSYDEYKEVYVYCRECEARTPVMHKNINYCAKDEVAKLWNRRVDNTEEQVDGN